MPVIDLRKSGAGASAFGACDVCIVGTGPAGTTLAQELSDTGLVVTVLESGDFSRSPRADRLNEVENVGRPRVANQWAVRNRIVGGSSHTWGGRCAPFDAIDFEERAWVPSSGWPFQLDDLVPYLDRTTDHLGLAFGTGFNDDKFWAIARRRPPQTEPRTGAVLPFFWQFSRDDDESYPYEYTRFGRGLTKRLGPNVTLVTGATVIGVTPTEDGRAVQSVEFADPGGSLRTLDAKAVVLCAGGIENARILLSSTRVTPQGLGNDHDLVGRYLMDHPRGDIGSFEVPGSQKLQKRLGRYNVQGHLFRAGFRLSPDVQRSEQLLNCSAWLGEVLAPDDPWEALRRVRGGTRKPGDVRDLAMNTGFLARGLVDYFIERNGVPRKYEALNLIGMCEQRPDPESRVTLSRERDDLGQQLPRIDWRIHEDEPRTMRRMAELVAEQLPLMGLPAPALADWIRDGADFPETFVDVAHPSSTTRMSADPTEGVVDANCQVHGVDGLYVAGSSIFPTVGHCNPTQMIVALAIRLADHVKERAAAVKPVVVSLTPEGSPPTVLVTGATGRIGRVVVADLIDRGYRVRASTSRPVHRIDDEGDIDWRHFDFLEAGPDDYDELVDGCAAVLHLAAEIGKQDKMPKINVEATRLLAGAAERSGVRSFCYTSTVSVYGSGRKRTMSEDAPVLTVGSDIPSEYLALDYVRAYGRTKLAGELALHEAAASVRYVILRPTVVVDIPAVIGIREWSLIKRSLAAHRNAHHIYVGDVSDAIIWSMERGLSGVGAPGSIETFNVSDDDFAEPTHAQFMRKAFIASGDKRFRVPKVPGVADLAHDLLRFRMLTTRNPLWRMRFPSNKLRTAGYSHRFGMERVHAMALEEVRKDAMV